MKINKNSSIVIVLLLSLVLYACDRNRIYDEYVEIDDYIWDASKNASFEFDIKDTTLIYNTYVNLRHASIYPYNNLWLFVRISAPNGKYKIDTLECNLIDKSGRWLGDGLGDIFDILIPWKLKTKFPLIGKYKVEYQQATRDEKLPGIMSIGLRVEKYQE